MPHLTSGTAFVIEENEQNVITRMQMFMSQFGLTIFHRREDAQEALKHFQSTTKITLRIYTVDVGISITIRREN